nr:InlB B-repeat-containing protein [Paracholeplasma sp.]
MLVVTALSFLMLSACYEELQPGQMPASVEFNVTETHVVWRYVGTEEWANLLELDLIRGAAGEPGENGKNVQFDVTETHIVWQYEGDETWTELILLSSFKGEDGLQGPAGNNGKDGISVVGSYINEAGILFLELSDETEIEVGLVRGRDGSDGKEVEFNVTETHIVWRYVGDTDWVDLVSLSTLKGIDGTNGSNGKEVLFDVTETHIVWQYEGDETWTDLILLSSFKGEDGLQGPAGNNGKDGISVVGSYINEAGILFLELSDETEIEVGLVRGNDGSDGKDGNDGLSAYEIYLKYNPNYNKSEAQWLTDLVKGRLSDSETTDVLTEAQLLEAISDLTVEKIQLQQPVTLTNDLVINREMTINFNDYNVKGNLSIVMETTEIVTLQNGTLDGRITVNQIESVELDNLVITGNVIDISAQLELLEQTVLDAIDYNYLDYTYLHSQMSYENRVLMSLYLESVLVEYNEELLKGVMDDMARFLGALYRVEGSSEHLSYDGVTYTWDIDGTLAGSNWKDDQGKTLVSVITEDFLQGQIVDNTITMSLFDDKGYGIDFALIFDLEMDQTEALENVVLETTTSGDLMTGLSFNYPDVISSYFDTHVYQMNTYISVSEDILGEITITMSGDMNRTEVLQGLPKGTYTFTELFNVSNILFDQQRYGGRVETYTITITNNLEPIEAVITMNNVISNDEFETMLTLADVSNDLMIEADEEASLQALDETFDDALAYVYTDYTYHYETQDVTNKHIHNVYSNWALYQSNSDDIHQGILFDMARFLGALHYVDGRVNAIDYDGITYTWNELGTLKGSNWENEQEQTLVSVITNDFMLGTLVQGVIFNIVDQNQFERQITLTFEITIDTLTVDFETNGGRAVEAILLLGGTKVSEPATTKDNHVFIGWYTDEILQTKYDFDDLVTSDLTLYARFIALEEITESFDNYTQGSYGNGTFVGTNDILWTYEVATGGSSGYFQFKDAGFLSATFNARIESISITASAFGADRSFDIIINDELHTFSHIGTTEVTYTIDQLMIDGQLTILINNPSASTKIHSISFTSSYPENGFSPELSDIANAIIVEESTFEPLKDVTAEDIEDYDLTNQIEVTVTDSNEQIVTNYGDFSQMAPGVYTITYRVMDSDLNETVKSITLTIEEYQVFSVTFYEDGGTNIDDLIDVEVGTTIIEPEISKDGFVFEGWYRDQALTTAYDFDSLMTADLNLYAKWAAITSINEIKSMADGEIINYVKGVVTGISLSNGNLYITDATGTIVVRDFNYYSVAVPGDEILLSNVVLDIYNGLYQLTNSTIEVLSADNTLITPTILTTLDGLTTADQGKRVSIENLEVVSISSQNLMVTDGTNQITVRVGSTNNEVYTYIQSALAGQKVNLTGIHVGWFNGAQFDLTSLDEIELVEASDAEKVLMIKDELIDLYDNKSYTSGSTITLIDTSTTHGGVITYLEATQLIDISTGLVGEVLTDTNVTLSITVTLNQETNTFTVALTVKPEGTEPMIVAQSDFGTTNNSNSNYGNFFIDTVDNGSLDPVAGTREYSRAGGNYNTASWDYIALGQKSVAARVGDLETSNSTSDKVDSTDPNVYLATNFTLSNLNHMIIAIPMLKALTTIHIQTSTDGITWTNLTTHVQDTQISSMTDITIELEQQGDFYYRLVFENASPTSSNGWLGRIKTITYYS